MFCPSSSVVNSTKNMYKQFDVCGLTEKNTRWERLKSALYLRLKKCKFFKICPGRIYGKLRKQFRDNQRGSLMIDNNRKPLFPHLEKKTFFERKFRYFSFGKCRIVPKNVKRVPFWDLSTYSLLQDIKKLERGPFGDCHSPLPVWTVTAKEWESEKGTGVVLDSPGGILDINLNLSNIILK